MLVYQRVDDLSIQTSIHKGCSPLPCLMTPEGNQGAFGRGLPPFVMLPRRRTESPTDLREKNSRDRWFSRLYPLVN